MDTPDYKATLAVSIQENKRDRPVGAIPSDEGTLVCSGEWNVYRSGTN